MSYTHFHEAKFYQLLPQNFSLRRIQYCTMTKNKLTHYLLKLEMFIAIVELISLISL